MVEYVTLLLNNGVGAFAVYLMFKIYMVSMSTYNTRIVALIEQNTQAFNKNTEAFINFKELVKAIKMGEIR